MSDPYLQFIRIDEPNDSRIEVYRDIRERDLLGSDSRPGIFLGEQFLIVQKMLKIPGVTQSILCTENWASRFQAETESGLPPIPVYIASSDLMKSIAGFHVHRGVLAVGNRPLPEQLALDAAVPDRNGDGPLTLLLCEDVSNIDNIGSLFRNAAAFGVDALVLSPSCHDPLYRKSVRVSIGHVLTMPWAQSKNWRDDLTRLKNEWNVTLIGAATASRAAPHDDITPPNRVGLIMGPEFEGLPASTLSLCDQIARIPMAAGIDSLNVGVASGVLLHHFSRGNRT